MWAYLDASQSSVLEISVWIVTTNLTIRVLFIGICENFTERFIYSRFTVIH